MKRWDVTALGELLIDFTEKGYSPEGNPLLEANPGGAPANVLAMLARLGHSGAFIGKVGSDMFGDHLESALAEAGIDTGGLVRDKSVPTTLAFVHTAQNGERSFSFYRSPGADMNLTEEELDTERLTQCRIFHFGSLSLTDEPSREATKAAVWQARRAGALISFDPNLRERLWKSPEEAKEQIGWGLAHSDIVKIADNEVVFLTGYSDIRKGIRRLRTDYPEIRLLAVTAGDKGSEAWCGARTCREPALKGVEAVDTTGAGDTFCACLLGGILDYGLEGMTETAMRNTLRIANAAAGLTVQRRGALKVMPTAEEVAQALGYLEAQ